MKIKNEMVNLKNGQKQFSFNNLILDEYLKKFVIGQLDYNKINSYNTSKELKYCLLKFDTPIKTLSNSSILYNQDFDICFVGGCIYEQNINGNQIITDYSYDTKWVVWDYKKNTASDNYISNYYGRKITAIGFNVTWMSYNEELGKYKFPVCAVLDTSNYNIYLQENQEISITRKDIITTDAIFYSNDKNKVPGPAHLIPFGIPQIINQPNLYNENKTSWVTFNNNCYGILHSIGISSYSDYIDKEFIIGQDIEVENNGTELNIKGIKNYLSTEHSFFCGDDIYSNTNLYPIKTNYKYIILKYKVWQMVARGNYNNYESIPTDTGYFYYQAIPTNKFGKSNLKIKYERG